MERRKLVLLIAFIAAGVVLALAFFLSSLNTPDETTLAPSSPTSQDREEDDEDSLSSGGGAPIGNNSDPSAPPEDAYANDYSGDTGYVGLPDSATEENTPPANTVFDEAWALTTTRQLACELASKETSTEEAIAPLRSFSSDLARATHPNAASLRSMISRWVNEYEDTLGERSPSSVRGELRTYCAAELSDDF